MLKKYIQICLFRLDSKVSTIWLHCVYYIIYYRIPNYSMYMKGSTISIKTNVKFMAEN